MRVISQDGTIDVPYEISSLSMAVGKYENVEHAAIEMLRNKYMEYTSTNYLKIFQFPAEEELE